MAQGHPHESRRTQGNNRAQDEGVFAGEAVTHVESTQKPGAEPWGGRCGSRRAAREGRERGTVKPPSALEAPLYRPFALLALAVTLGVATPVGAITLYRLTPRPAPSRASDRGSTRIFNSSASPASLL